MQQVYLRVEFSIVETGPSREQIFPGKDSSEMKCTDNRQQAGISFTA